MTCAVRGAGCELGANNLVNFSIRLYGHKKTS